MTVLQCWDAFQSQGSSAKRSRFITEHYLSWLRMREWADVRRQISQTFKQYAAGKLPTSRDQRARSASHIDALHRAVLSGMLGMVLVRDEQERCYRAAGNRALQVHPSSVLIQQRDKGKGRQTQPLASLSRVL